MGFERFGWVSYASQTRISKFVDLLREGKIYGTECKECGYVQFPPRAHCVKCLSSGFEWKELTGNCVLITYTKVDATPSMFKDYAPTSLVLRNLLKVRKSSWIDKGISDDEISIGMKLKLRETNLANGNLCYTLVRPNAT